MGLFDVLKGKANTLIENMENPEETLALALKEQQDLLKEVEKGLATITAQRRELEQMRADYSAEVAQLSSQAATAVEQGKDDLATQALTRKVRLEGDIKELVSQTKTIKTEEAKLKSRKCELESRIEELGQEKKTLAARLKAAETMKRVSESVAGIDGKVDSSKAVQKITQRIDTANARTSAIGELTEDGTLGPGSSLENKLQGVTDAANVAGELARLKAAKAKK
jgi:phage shock protein A